MTLNESINNNNKKDTVIIETSFDELSNNSSTESATINEKNSSIEEDLKNLEKNEESPKKKEKNVKKEIKTILKLAIPISISELLKYLVLVVSNVFVGHIGSTELAGIALANTFCSSTGWYVISGLGTALDTLCSQSYTAAKTNKERKILGTIVQRSFAILLVLCIPIATLWFFSETFFKILGQDKDVSKIACEYCRIMILALIPYIVFDYLRRYVQTQGIVRPPTYIIGLTAPINILLHYILLNTDMSPLSKEKRYLGAPIAVVIIYWLLAFLIIIYIRFSKAKDCWGKINIKSAFTGWKDFFSLGIPGLLMILSEALVYQLFSIISGVIGKIELAAQSVLLSISSCFFNSLMGIATAACVRVGNLLGEGNREKAKFSTKISLIMALCVTTINGIILFTFRRSFAKVFSEEEEVIELVSNLVIIVSIFELADGIVTPGSGILRGCGRQKIGAIMNLVTYWVCGVPAGLILAFIFHLNMYGIWLGLTVSIFIYSILMIFVIRGTNWKKECEKAKERFELQKNK